MTEVIEELKTTPENSGKVVTYDGIKCHFLWFYTENTIDLQPIGNILVIAVPRKNWGQIQLT